MHALNKDDWSDCSPDNQTNLSRCLQNGLFVQILRHKHDKKGDLSHDFTSSTAPAILF